MPAERTMKRSLYPYSDPACKSTPQFPLNRRIRRPYETRNGDDPRIEVRYRADEADSGMFGKMESDDIVGLP